MKVRIEVEWDELTNLVGHAKARGLCRKAGVVLLDGSIPAIDRCPACGRLHEDPMPVPPWDKPFYHKTRGEIL